MPELTVKLGDQILQTCRFDGELLRIGRSRENDIVLENLSVSRDHAQIRFHENRFILTDMNSANGTLVNGVRVTKTEIVDDDVITVGKHKLHFRNVPAEVESEADGLTGSLHTVMVEPRTEACLVVESGRLAGREFRITRFETSLGKAATNDIVLTDDWLLGKKQAIILRKGNNAFEVQDLGGLRRVKVNGTAINERADIADGDVIEMGGTKLRFQTAAAHSIPTGRVPKEMPAEVSPEPHREAGSLIGRRNPTKPAMPSLGHIMLPHGDESLDLEDGYQSVKIRLTDESGSTPAVSAAADTDSSGDLSRAELMPPPPSQADPHGSDYVTDETAKTPAVTAAMERLPGEEIPNHSEREDAPAFDTPVMLAKVESSESDPDRQRGSGGLANMALSDLEAASKNRSSADEAPRFNDRPSTGRRRRKHQMRQLQEQKLQSAPKTPANTGANSLAAPDKPSTLATQPNDPSLSAQPDLPLEKEIQMWEDALNNPSPAIQRQAARMLKKLTGRTYEA